MIGYCYLLKFVKEYCIMLEFNFLRVNIECVKEGFRVCNFLDEVLFIVDDIINFDDCCKVI